MRGGGYKQISTLSTHICRKSAGHFSKIPLNQLNLSIDCSQPMWRMNSLAWVNSPYFTGFLLHGQHTRVSRSIRCHLTLMSYDIYWKKHKKDCVWKKGVYISGNVKVCSNKWLIFRCSNLTPRCRKTLLQVPNKRGEEGWKIIHLLL